MKALHQIKSTNTVYLTDNEKARIVDLATSGDRVKIQLVLGPPRQIRAKFLLEDEDEDGNDIEYWEEEWNNYGPLPDEYIRWVDLNYFSWEIINEIVP